VLAAFEESGLTMTAFAGREGFDCQRLQRWRRVLGASVAAPAFEEVPRAEIVPALGPVASEAAKPEADGGALEIVLTSGRVVRVPPSFDTATLRRLLAVLDEVDAC